MVHVSNLWINRNEELKNDYAVPGFMAKILELEDIYLSYSNFENNAVLKQFASESSMETYSCVT